LKCIKLNNYFYQRLSRVNLKHTTKKQVIGLGGIQNKILFSLSSIASFYAFSNFQHTLLEQNLMKIVANNYKTGTEPDNNIDLYLFFSSS